MLAAGDGFGFFFILIVVGLVIAAVVWGAKHQKAIRENWAAFAARNNMQYMGTTFGGMSGWYNRVAIRINTITRGSGKNRTTYTQFHGTIASPMPHGLVLYKEGFFSKVGKMLGGQDVQVGDPAIDNAFIIKAEDLLGTHKLLSIAQVRSALLTIVQRHPGLRVDGRTVMWEQTGVVHKYEQLDANAQDLAYLCSTFDAAFHQLAGSQPKAQAAPARPAAAAEILAATAPLGMPSQPQVRRAEPQDDPAQRRKAMSDMAGVLHALEDKMEKGQWTPQPKSAEPISLESAFDESKAEDAFAAPTAPVFGSSQFEANAYAAPKPSDAFNAAKPPAFASSQFDANPFAAPKASDAFDAPKPFETARPAAEPAAAEATGGFDDVIASLVAASMSFDRDKIIQANANRVWPVTVKVERVDSTFGFDVPDSLKDGKTIEGELAGGTKVTLRLPKSRNDEVGKLHGGGEVKAIAGIAGWDDLFKKLTLNG